MPAVVVVKGEVVQVQVAEVQRHLLLILILPPVADEILEETEAMEEMEETEIHSPYKAPSRSATASPCADCRASTRLACARPWLVSA